MDVLVTCPSARDRKALTQIPGYTFHLLDAQLNARTPSPECDILDYLERCRQYIRTHHIDAIYYSRDVADIVAAALCEEFGFPGPSVESVFLCLHKYYSRRNEPAPIRCQAIDLDDDHPPVTEYPCYLKPPWLNLGILGFKLECPDDLRRALTVARREYHSWSPLYYPFFRQYIDLQKYPLAVRDIMLVEEFIDGEQVTVEGWVYQNQIHLWAITDTNTYPSTRVIDNFSLPSQQPVHIQEQLAQQATAAIRNIGLNNGFFNIEFWCHEDTVTLTEINGRAATCFYHLYRNCLEACVYEAGLALACGRNPALPPALNGTVGAQCNFVTFGTDRAENLLDFECARAIPQLALYVSEGDWVKPVSEFGFVLAQIDLFGRSYAEIKEEVDRLRRMLLKQPETSPWG
jgi:hypothetical protein